MSECGRCHDETVALGPDLICAPCASCECSCHVFGADKCDKCYPTHRQVWLKEAMRKDSDRQLCITTIKAALLFDEVTK